MKLSARNAILNVGLLYDVTAPPRDVSVPPVLDVDSFVRLRVTVNAPAETADPPQLVVRMDTAVTCYAHTVVDGVLLGEVPLVGPAAAIAVNVPRRGLLFIDHGRIMVPEIARLFCPVNTRVLVDIAPWDHADMRGLAITGQRRGIMEPPCGSPTVLRTLTPVMPPDAARVQVELLEHMTVVHKYQFSVMSMTPDGTVVYSPKYWDLLPGGRIVQGVFSAI